MASSVFEREIGKFLETQCCLVIHQIDLQGPRFTIRKTVDYVCCHEGGAFWAVEVKQTCGDSFAFSRVRPHQREALTAVANTTNGQSYLALNFRSPGVGSAYMIPWSWLKDFIATWPKKSVKKKEAESEFLPFSLRRTSGGWERRGNFFSQP